MNQLEDVKTDQLKKVFAKAMKELGIDIAQVVGQKIIDVAKTLKNKNN